MKQLYLAEKKRRRIGMFRWMKIEYYLTKEVCASETQTPVYGISIVKKDGSHIESEHTGGVSHSYEVVEGMLKTLANCIITPMAMLEVVDEMVTTRICS